MLAAILLGLLSVSLGVEQCWWSKAGEIGSKGEWCCVVGAKNEILVAIEHKGFARRMGMDVMDGTVIMVY